VAVVILEPLVMSEYFYPLQFSVSLCEDLYQPGLALHVVIDRLIVGGYSGSEAFEGCKHLIFVRMFGLMRRGLGCLNSLLGWRWSPKLDVWSCLSDCSWRIRFHRFKNIHCMAWRPRPCELNHEAKIIHETHG
jgi:hypothetical protein